MAKTQKGLDDDGKVRVVADKKRGSVDRTMTTKENIPARLAGRALKAAGGAVKKGFTDRRCR